MINNARFALVVVMPQGFDRLRPWLVTASQLFPLRLYIFGLQAGGVGSFLHDPSYCFTRVP
ncbi:hypothetical protein RA276_28645, partial [Pseudomonas syringae pv. tagetis]|uniref:hypothetical protein n=1 Tax=Pseudomonas syringae group genomosp. 7 TaxID=251699 RepID=UPI0037703400